MLGFVSLLMDMSSEMIHALLPLFLVTTLGASAAVVGVIEGIAEATASVVKVFSGWLSDRLGRRKLLAVAGYALGAVTKPVFALAVTLFEVLAARFADRVGKGIRGAPRDALVADVTPTEIRGRAYGIRQALDIMYLDQILFEVEKRDIRNPDLYYFTVFGEPSLAGAWGFRVEGHHLSLNFTIDSGKVIEQGRKSRFLLRIANWLHYNRGKKAWTYIADAYAVLLLYLAVSGIFMIKGKKGLKWRGTVLLLLGASVPIAYVSWSGGPDAANRAQVQRADDAPAPTPDPR